MKLIFLLIAATVALLGLGIEEAIIAHGSVSQGPVKMTLAQIGHEELPSSWVTIGEHYVDWDSAVIRCMDDHCESYNRVSYVFYPLQLRGGGGSWSNGSTVVIVRTDRFELKKDVPKGIQKVMQITGSFGGSVDDYHSSIIGELKSNHPGIDLNTTLVLHDGKKPSVVLAVLLILGGIACAAISILLVLSMLKNLYGRSSRKD